MDTFDQTLARIQEVRDQRVRLRQQLRFAIEECAAIRNEVTAHTRQLRATLQGDRVPWRETTNDPAAS